MKHKETFAIKNKKYEVFFAEDDDQIEVYELDNPKNGLIFEDRKRLNAFINSITDILEKREWGE